MLDELIQVVQHQTNAAQAVESRLRALELLAAAGEHRFVALATDEFEAAAERLAALELTRSLTAHAAGMSPDTPASTVAAGVDDRMTARQLVSAVEGLRDAVARIEDARERARTALTGASKATRARLEAAQVMLGA